MISCYIIIKCHSVKSFGMPSNFSKKHKNSFLLYLYTAFMLHMLYLHT